MPSAVSARPASTPTPIERIECRSASRPAHVNSPALASVAVVYRLPSSPSLSRSSEVKCPANSAM